jgi:hypothetical protein
MLDVGNRGFSDFLRDCWRSFPGHLLEMAEVQKSGYFQTSNCRGVTVALNHLVCSNWFLGSVETLSRVSQDERQRCDGIPRVAPPGS